MKKLMAVLLVLAPLYGGAGDERKAFSARAVSVYGGLNWSKYSDMPNVATIPEVYGRQARVTGAVAGLAAEIYLSDHILIDSGVLYIRKGNAVDWFFMDWSLMGESIGRWRYALDIVSFPITFRFKPLAGSSPYLLAGYELAVVAGHKMTEATGPAGPDPAKLTNDTREIDLGLIAGVGAELSLGKLTPFVELRYDHGLLDLSKATGSLESYRTILTRSFVLMAGVRIKLRS